MAIKVHIACDSKVLRRSLAALLDSQTELEVCHTSPEGVRGVAEVRATNADVLLLSVPEGENTAEAVRWYRAAMENSALVGYCLHASQGEEYRRAGVDEWVPRGATSAVFLKAIQRVRTGGEPTEPAQEA